MEDDETGPVSSLQELELYWQELLDQYVGLKSYLQFCKSLRENMGYGQEPEVDNPAPASELMTNVEGVEDISQNLEFTLADASHLEISKEAHYEDLADDLRQSIDDENDKIAGLSRELDEAITSLNKKQYLAKTHNLKALEQEYRDIDRQLNQLLHDRAEQEYLVNMRQSLRQQNSNLYHQLERVNNNIEMISQYHEKQRSQNERTKASLKTREDALMTAHRLF